MSIFRDGVELIGLDSDSSQIHDLAFNIVKDNFSSKGFCPDPKAMRLKRMKSSVLTSARLLQSKLKLDLGRNSTHKAAMITLTYSDDNFDPNDIRNFLTCVRNYLSRLGGYKFYYVWVAELQTRGVLHYHVVCYLPRCKLTGKFLRLPKPDDRGWWKKGSTNVKWAKFAPGYLAKYASKEDSKNGKFPKGCRLHGSGGLNSSERIEVRWYKLPRFVKDIITEIVDVRKVSGGYVERDTGFFIKSPWRFVGFLPGKRPFFIHD